MSTKALIASLLGGIAYFILGFLIYGIAINSMPLDLVTEGFNRSDEEMLYIPLVISCFLYAVFLAYVFSKWASISTFSGGLKGGVIIGLLITAAFGTNMYAVSHVYVSVNGMFVDIIAGTIMSGITGGVVGWWLGRK